MAHVLILDSPQEDRFHQSDPHFLRPKYRLHHSGTDLFRLTAKPNSQMMHVSNLQSRA